MPSADAKLLSLAEDVIGLNDLADFHPGLLDALRRVVPSDFASLNHLGPGPADVTVTSIPPPRPELVDEFVRYGHQNPIASFHARTHDGRAYRFSDLITRRELRQLELYQRVYAPLGVEHQIAFTLRTEPNRVLAVALSRSHRDYTNTERDLLNRARPLLIQAFRTAIEHDQLTDAIAALRSGRAIADSLRAAGLTPREAQVGRLLAYGRSKRDVAGELGISPRTVAKHLERCFKKLGVSTQSGVAAKAWTLIAQPPPAVPPLRKTDRLDRGSEGTPC